MSIHICKVCNQELPAEEFYSNGKGGLDSTCKGCRKAKQKETYHANPYRSWAKNSKAYHESNGTRVRFELDELEQVARTHCNCMLCGKQVVYGPKGSPCGDSPTLNKLNNAPYIDKNNVFILCWSCNKAIQNRTLKEFVQFCTMIVNRFTSD